jgi:hypothetical protein
MPFPSPAEDNAYLADHVALMRYSFRHWTQRDLFDPGLTHAEAALFAFHARFALVSHDMAPDPVFTYGNETALGLFGMTWDEFTALPSRFSAAPVSREERARLLEQVTARGYIDDYQGIRIARGGQRFRIDQAVVWNLIDPAGTIHGQAATFPHWTMLADSDAPAP